MKKLFFWSIFLLVCCATDENETQNKTVERVDVYSIPWRTHHYLQVLPGIVKFKSGVAHTVVDDPAMINYLLENVKGMPELEKEEMDDFYRYFSPSCDSRLDCEICYSDGSEDIISFDITQYPFVNGKVRQLNPELLDFLSDRHPAKNRPEKSFSREERKQRIIQYESRIDSLGLRKMFDSIYEIRAKEIEAVIDE